MSKLIFILFLFFCSLHSFSQESLSSAKINNADFSNKINGLEKEKNETAKVQEPNEKEIVKIYKDNLCDVLTIKVSDLLNESMLKKLLANV
ncbi:hypothetical protein [Flavobacterium laiguense]|uniref:Uncharacterized protein n=1 Tax=Flavobacterium laiguense TaxID=2169409 RepID=A0A2U1JLE4_9FLAO|nr:hypothetical protein [Flavobacterium laiguense]PWA05987.1 hypothetical protein DB891_16440 [Flavobacterium laiguense]